MLWALLRQDGSLLEGLILESHDAVVHVHCYQVPIVFANHAMIYEMCRSGTFSSHHCYLESRDVILRTCIHRSSYSSLLLLATCSPDPRQETGSQYGCASPSLQYPRMQQVVFYIDARSGIRSRVFQPLAGYRVEAAYRADGMYPPWAVDDMRMMLGVQDLLVTLQHA